MTDEPDLVLKRAIDVTPHYHGIWCTVGGGEPFVNEIVSRKWSEDGNDIWFMLDTHNFARHQPHEQIRVVELDRSDRAESTRTMWAEGDAKAMANRPSPPPEKELSFLEKLRFAVGNIAEEEFNDELTELDCPVEPAWRALDVNVRAKMRQRWRKRGYEVFDKALAAVLEEEARKTNDS